MESINKERAVTFITHIIKNNHNVVLLDLPNLTVEGEESFIDMTVTSSQTEYTISADLLQDGISYSVKKSTQTILDEKSSWDDYDNGIVVTKISAALKSHIN